MSAALDRFLAALRAHGSDPHERGGGWEARCPAHEDGNPSLTVHEGEDGKVLVRCHAGCSFADIVAAVGLEQVDLFNNNHGDRGRGRKVIVAKYDYHDLGGAVLFQVVRYQPKDFRQRRPDGNGGWTWNLQGVQRVLYHLPTIAQVPEGSYVYVPEGEKDVDRLVDAGLFATCCPGGAGKWSTLCDDGALEGHHVVLLPDADGPGRNHAQDVARRLHGRAASIRVLELPGLADGQDVSDWLETNDTEELDRLAVEAPEWEPTEIVATPTTVTVQANGLTEREAKRIIQDGARYWNQGTECCHKARFKLLEFFEGGGVQALKGVGFAAALYDITPGSVYRLANEARVIRELGLEPSDSMSQRMCLALVPFIGQGAQVMEDVIERGRQLMLDDGRKKLTGKYVRKAAQLTLREAEPEPVVDEVETEPEPATDEVDEELPPWLRLPPKKMTDQQRRNAELLWHAIAHAHGLAMAQPEAPEELRHGLEGLTKVAYQWKTSP